MAIRTIREAGDEILRGSAKPVTEMTPRISAAISDMYETMYDAAGVGLAAPQIGIRKRFFVVDVPDEDGSSHKYTMINPEILETSGEQEGFEGCLSVPGKHGMVIRPMRVRVRAQGEDMQWYEVEAEGLLARAILHENDHLNGILYTDLVKGELLDNDEEEE